VARDGDAAIPTVAEQATVCRMPRVTVVMPVFNGEATVLEALQSVRGQTWPHWQVLVSDDKSDDDTVALVHDLADPRIRIIQSETNTGPAGARNRALALVDTELVAFLDADDVWLPEYLETQVSRYDRETCRPGPAVGAIACDAFIEIDGRRADGTYYEQFGRRAVDPVTVEGLLRRNTVFISCLVPRTVGEELGWFDPTLFVSEDYDLWLKIVESGHRIVVERSPLAVYRRTGASISHNTERQAVHNQRVIGQAVLRGRLTRRQRRIARAELRYNQALEVVSGMALHGRRPRLTELPNALLIAVSRPRHWREWTATIRSR
jgi:teichuronic acid biosynthesis glycosyltransferase TuaG